VLSLAIAPLPARAFFVWPGFSRTIVRCDSLSQSRTASFITRAILKFRADQQSAKAWMVRYNHQVTVWLERTHCGSLRSHPGLSVAGCAPAPSAMSSSATPLVSRTQRNTVKKAKTDAME
jgi:hypothetical protein